VFSPVKPLPPVGFAYHNARIVRGRYPDQAAAKFVTDLGVRKFVSLGMGFPGDSEREFGRANKIELIHFPIQVGFVNDESFASAIDYIVTKNDGSMIYTYDDDGFTFVGPLCAVLRRIEGWDTASALEECQRFFPAGQMTADVIRKISSFNIAKWR